MEPGLRPPCLTQSGQKCAAPSQSSGNFQSRARQNRSVAPPVYRPASSNHAQAKIASTHKIGSAPPVYRPKPLNVSSPPAVQPKTNGLAKPHAAFPGPKAGGAPPVYRPQQAVQPKTNIPITARANIAGMAPASIRLKGTPASPKVSGAPPVYRPQPANMGARTAVQPKSGRPAAPPVYRPNNGLPVFPGAIAPKALNSIQRQVAGQGAAKSARVAPPRNGSVIQGLIVLDQDVDVSRVMVAYDIYSKWLKKGKEERITTMQLADLSGLKKDEKLYLVAHGSTDTHGDRTAENLARLLQEKGLPSGNVIKLISCNTGDGDGKSFAAKLGNVLERKNTVIGFRGFQTTEGDGHVRSAIDMPQEHMEQYNKMMEDLALDPGFQQIEVLVGKLKRYLAVATDEQKVHETVLNVAKKVNALGEEANKKIDAVFGKYIATRSKQDSEYIHAALTETQVERPMGPSGFPMSSFNPDYPNLEFSF